MKIPVRMACVVGGTDRRKEKKEEKKKNHYDAPCSALSFNAAIRSLFLLPRMRNVFSRSMGAILSQLVILLIVPSLLTTMGPRASKRMLWSASACCSDDEGPLDGAGRPR